MYRQVTQVLHIRRCTVCEAFTQNVNLRHVMGSHSEIEEFGQTVIICVNTYNVKYTNNKGHLNNEHVHTRKGTSMCGGNQW